MRLIVKANDDEDILNFLADLEDRTPIRVIDERLKENNKDGLFIIDKHKKENIITIVLCNAPFEVNENGNILMLFAHSDLAVIQGYFKRLMGATDYKEKDKRALVRQILYVIDYFRKHQEELENSQISTEK